MRLANAKYDSFVISVPKSGRTWHRLLLGYYLTRISGEEPRNALMLETLCERAGIGRIAYSHNGTSQSDKLPPSSAVVASPIEWRNRNVLLIVRDPRDVLVSAYHHCRFRERSFDGPVSAFIRHPFAGLVKILTAHNRWHQTRHLAGGFDVISYEQMRSNPGEALHKALLFAGIKNPDPRIIAEAVNFTSFENMQRLEQSDYFQSAEMRNTSGDSNSRKVRSGKVGEFKELLSEDDIGYINETVGKMGNPFAVDRLENR